nr:hypothetical protein StreXyl84_79660 [Streptomyces sp. Xyl84]
MTGDGAVELFRRADDVSGGIGAVGLVAMATDAKRRIGILGTGAWRLGRAVSLGGDVSGSRWPVREGGAPYARRVADHPIVGTWAIGGRQIWARLPSDR